MIDASLIAINSYEFNLKPFAYRLSLEGRLEISSRYKLGSKLLSGKFYFPNQTIDLVDIIPDYTDRCRIGGNNCKVFRLKTFIQLSGDKYFSREFDEPENVPFRFTLDFDAGNLSSFRSYNPSFRQDSGSRDQPRRLSGYVAAINLLSIDSHFRYQNSFYVERRGSRQDRFFLKIPVSWTVGDGAQRSSYEIIGIKIKNYDWINDHYIRDWFSIQDIGRTKVDQAHVTFRDGSTLNLPTDEMSRSSRHGWNSYHLRGTISREGNQYKYEQDYRNSGIFFPNSIGGTLNVRLHLLLRGHGYYITIKNPFFFSGRHLKDHNLFLTVWIQNKTDHFFGDLRRFRFINL